MESAVPQPARPPPPPVGMKRHATDSLTGHQKRLCGDGSAIVPRYSTPVGFPFAIPTPAAGPSVAVAHNGSPRRTLRAPRASVAAASASCISALCTPRKTEVCPHRGCAYTAVPKAMEFHIKVCPFHPDKLRQKQQEKVNLQAAQQRNKQLDAASRVRGSAASMPAPPLPRTAKRDTLVQCPWCSVKANPDALESHKTRCPNEPGRVALAARKAANLKAKAACEFRHRTVQRTGAPPADAPPARVTQSRSLSAPRRPTMHQPAVAISTTAALVEVRAAVASRPPIAVRNTKNSPPAAANAPSRPQQLPPPALPTARGMVPADPNDELPSQDLIAELGAAANGCWRPQARPAPIREGQMNQNRRIAAAAVAPTRRSFSASANIRASCAAPSSADAVATAPPLSNTRIQLRNAHCVSVGAMQFDAVAAAASMPDRALARPSSGRVLSLQQARAERRAAATVAEVGGQQQQQQQQQGNSIGMGDAMVLRCPPPAATAAAAAAPAAMPEQPEVPTLDLGMATEAETSSPPPETSSPPPETSSPPPESISPPPSPRSSPPTAATPPPRTAADMMQTPLFTPHAETPPTVRTGAAQPIGNPVALANSNVAVSCGRDSTDESTWLLSSMSTLLQPSPKATAPPPAPAPAQPSPTELHRSVMPNSTAQKKVDCARIPAVSMSHAPMPPTYSNITFDAAPNTQAGIRTPPSHRRALQARSPNESRSPTVKAVCIGAVAAAAAAPSPAAESPINCPPRGRMTLADRRQQRKQMLVDARQRANHERDLAQTTLQKLSLENLQDKWKQLHQTRNSCSAEDLEVEA